MKNSNTSPQNDEFIEATEIKIIVYDVHQRLKNENILLL